MTAALHYWLATIDADGAPRVRPVDGMWLDDALYFDGDPHSMWRKNLNRDARASLHLEHAEEAVTMRGDVVVVTPDRALAVRLADAANAKYGFNQKPEEYEAPALVFRPRVAHAWTLLYKDATRWDL
jgi:hypothetical protein